MGDQPGFANRRARAWHICHSALMQLNKETDMKHQTIKNLTLCAALLSVAWGGSALANRLDDIKAKGTIVCGTQNASSPYGFQDPDTRQYVGYDVDMCMAIGKEMGLKVQHKP